MRRPWLVPGPSSLVPGPGFAVHGPRPTAHGPVRVGAAELSIVRGVESCMATGVRFGDFQLDLDTGELFRNGTPVSLERQPARALMLLASRPGALVTREELRRAIWDADTFVDFERGLNYCIRHLRAAFGDDARRPRYIETIPRQGYRFVAKLRHDTGQAPIVPTAANDVPRSFSRPSARSIGGHAAALAAGALLTLVWSTAAS